MPICNYKVITIALILITLSGCATVSYLTGGESYWAKPAPVSKQAKAYSLHLSGIIHKQRGDLDQATAAWNELIEIDEHALAPYIHLINIQVRQGNNAKALTLCQQALQYFPDRAELWIVYGELSHRQGAVETAITAFMKAIELRPDDLTGYGALVELQESTNDLVATIDIYEHLIRQSPKSAALYYQLGINLAQINDTEYARKNFEKVLELEPRITRARYFLALTLFESGSYENCAAELKRYLKDRPHDTSALEYRAAALARIGRLDEARYSLELIMAGKEATKKHALQYAWILLETGQIEKAQQFSLEAEAYLFADIIFAFNLLATVPAKDRPAIPFDDTFSLDSVEMESDMFIASVMRAFGNELSGRKTLAILSVLDKVVVFSPALSLFRAHILIHLGQYEEAIAVLNLILKNDSTSKYAHYHSAIAYEKLGNLSQTEYHLRAYLDIEPNDPNVLNFLGYFYADHAIHLNDAKKLLNRALEQEPDNPFFLDSLGWLYFRQGKAKKAIKLIRRAIYNMESDDALLRGHLGDVYFFQGNITHAISEWQRAVRLDPSLKDVRTKLNEHAPAGKKE